MYLIYLVLGSAARRVARLDPAHLGLEAHLGLPVQAALKAQLGLNLDVIEHIDLGLDLVTVNDLELGLERFLVADVNGWRVDVVGNDESVRSLVGVAKVELLLIIAAAVILGLLTALVLVRTCLLDLL